MSKRSETHGCFFELRNDTCENCREDGIVVVGVDDDGVEVTQLFCIACAIDSTVKYTMEQTVEMIQVVGRLGQMISPAAAPQLSDNGGTPAHVGAYL